MNELQAFYRLAYNKEASDCAVRSLAVACAAPYRVAHAAMADVGRIAGGPVSVRMMEDAATRLGYEMTQFETPGKTLRTAERALRRTPGGYILTTCDHAVGIWNGELIDFMRGSLLRVEHAFTVKRRR